ncbi:hypothetical protein AU476_24555 [Cupriavidus sp. UYMSc13B]|nr:hypothetical protein AU476_24555 [Cupriavidus sp. UYMSc13B]
MITFGTRARAEATRRAVPVQLEDGISHQFHKSEWMETGQDPKLSPSIFLVEQPAYAVAPAHFHRQNQFQLFIEGDGQIGRRPLQPLTIHYAGAYTGYGPLVAGPDGLKYFTIRPVFETGLTLVSEREKMVRGPKRHEHAGPIRVAAASQLRDLRGPAQDDVIPLGADGLGVTLAEVPGGEALVPGRPPHAGDLFIVVLAGQLNAGGQSLGQWESVFISADEALPDMVAAGSGAQVALLYTPEKAAAYL